MKHPSTRLPLFLTLITVACGDNGGTTEAASTSSETGTATSAATDTETEPTGGVPVGPTYWQEVAPIFFDSCGYQYWFSKQFA